MTNAPYAAAVTLMRVINDPSVTLAPGLVGRPVQQASGQRFVALEFAVTNVGGTTLDDGGQEHETNLMSWVVTPDDRVFYAVQATVPGCAPLFGLRLDPGARATVCDVFQVGDADRVVYASVQMNVGYVDGNAVANWLVP